MRLKGKTAIVTGGGSGFGAGIVRKFVAEGARVMVADINGEAAKAVAKEVGGVACKVDVGSADSVKVMAGAAVVEFGAIEFWSITLVLHISPNLWKRSPRKNLTAC